MTRYLLANHGAVTMGGNVMSAYYKMETIEHAAMIQFIARQIVKSNELDKKQVERLISQREMGNSKRHRAKNHWSPPKESPKDDDLDTHEANAIQFSSLSFDFLFPRK